MGPPLPAITGEEELGQVGPPKTNKRKKAEEAILTPNIKEGLTTQMKRAMTNIPNAEEAATA